MKFRRFICRKQTERVFTTTAPPTEKSDSERNGPLVTAEQLKQNRYQSSGEKTTSLALVRMSAQNGTADSGSDKSLDSARHKDPNHRKEISSLSFVRRPEISSHVDNPSCEPSDSEIETPKRKGSGKILEDPFYSQESSLFSLLRRSETSSDGETLNCDLGSDGSTQFAVIGREADTSSSEDNSDDDVDDDDYTSEDWHLFLRSFGSCGGAALIGKGHSQNAMS